MTTETDTEAKPKRSGFYTNVRYGKMLIVSRCRTDRDDLRVRDKCIVRTDRGKEIGTVLSPLQPLPEGGKPNGMHNILRRASSGDVENAEKIDKETRVRSKAFCRDEIKKLKLDMKVVEVDQLFGGERIIFYFTAETRVDFRELVRILARELRTRVELRQIGGRDEARLVGDCGHCGLELCCKGFIKELGGITMEMAKIQKHTSDPSKITGRCGKLLCCLRYEYSTYTEARKALPGKGKYIKTRIGEGKVLQQNLLMREVTIETEGNKRVVVKLEEIEGVREKVVAGCDGCAAPKDKSGDSGKRVAEAEPEGPETKKIRQEIETETKVMPPKIVGASGETTMIQQKSEGAGEGEPPKKKRRRRRRRRRKPGGENPGKESGGGS